MGLRTPILQGEVVAVPLASENRDEPQPSILSKHLLQVSTYANIKAISVWSTDKNWSCESL